MAKTDKGKLKKMAVSMGLMKNMPKAKADMHRMADMSAKKKRTKPTL